MSGKASSSQSSWTARSKTSPEPTGRSRMAYLALSSGESRRGGSKDNTIQAIYFSREVDESYPGFHLIYTNMGNMDNTTKASDCFSYVGRTDRGGQVVNLGSEQCLNIGKILHETLHGLGWKLYSLLLCLFLFEVPHTSR